MEPMVLIFLSENPTGKEMPRRMVLERSPSANNSELSISSGHATNTLIKKIRRDVFLRNYPELTCVVNHMNEGDVALGDDTIAGVEWTVKNKDQCVKFRTTVHPSGTDLSNV